MKNFKLTLTFDGQFLSMNYHDGSDIEHRTASNPDKLMAEVREAVRTALSEED